ncbi:MAG: hypothetical protein H6837_12990 [Planctomycetes bacterium]|nr:hypothetical protein [Planctomycetota bacterium]
MLVAAGARDGAMVMAQKDDGLILGHFDRNTFFNTNVPAPASPAVTTGNWRATCSGPWLSVQGRWQSIGPPCGGAGRTPALILGDPNLGRAMFWSLRGAAANQATGLLLSLGSAKPSTIPGPCVVQVDLANAMHEPLGVTDATGSFVTSFALPNSHVLSGTKLTVQMVIASPVGPGLGVLELSDAAEVRLGFAR